MKLLELGRSYKMSHLKTKGQWKKHQKDQKLTGPGIHKSNGF